MPQGEDLDRRAWSFEETVVQVVSNPSEMHAPDAGKREIAGSGAEARL
jgi:hypothetical protein